MPGQGLWFWLQWLQSVVFTGSGYVSAVLYNIFNVCCTIAFPACVMQCYYPQPIRPLPKAIVLWISLFVLFVGAQWCIIIAPGFWLFCVGTVVLSILWQWLWFVFFCVCMGTIMLGSPERSYLFLSFSCRHCMLPIVAPVHHTIVAS